ncbi:hypothetical protein REPUB_Repub16aG0117500 [Reevesia pubescens]
MERSEIAFLFVAMALLLETETPIASQLRPLQITLFSDRLLSWLQLLVTNTESKAEEIVRIVDACGAGGLELDLKTAFNTIDTDGNGITQGHLIVDYEFVDCGDSEENTLLVYSQ